MKYTFTINGQLPSLNEYLSAERIAFRGRRGKYTTKGNEMKRSCQSHIISCIRRDLGNLHINKPIVLNYNFYEPNRKRDCDNIFSVASKYTQDSLVKAEVIENDGQRWIKGFNALFFVDKKNPRIVVEIEEVGVSE